MMEELLNLLNKIIDMLGPTNTILLVFIGVTLLILLMYITTVFEADITHEGLSFFIPKKYKVKIIQDKKIINTVKLRAFSKYQAVEKARKSVNPSLIYEVQFIVERN